MPRGACNLALKQGSECTFRMPRGACRKNGVRFTYPDWVIGLDLAGRCADLTLAKRWVLASTKEMGAGSLSRESNLTPPAIALMNGSG